MNEDELLYLLKHGRADEVRFIFKDIQAKSYPEDFSTFIDTMIKEHKIKRKNIAIRSGLSQDYTYKLLRGDKKTTERDYILAICIAIGMNLAQVPVKFIGNHDAGRSDQLADFRPFGSVRANGGNVDGH